MISFVYFDVGGVVIKDFSNSDKWQLLWRELGVTPELDEAFQKIWRQHEPKLCLDQDVDALLPIISQELGVQVPAGYSLLDGFVRHFEANPDIWPLIKQTQQRARVGLLTNMYPNMLAATTKRGLTPDIQWDVVVDSSVELYQKPDPRIFELAQDKARASGHEILFIDNTPGHVEAAKKFGWQVYLYDSSDYQQATRDLELFLSNLQTTSQ